jgi:hypothetical protein
MMKNINRNRLRVSGIVTATVFDAVSGLMLQRLRTENIATDDGLELYAQLVNKEAVDSPNYCGVGSGETEPDHADSTLEDEIGRVVVTEKSRSANVITYDTFFSSADCNGSWNKTGLFNAGVGGVLAAEALFESEIVKNTNKTVMVSWEITFS